MWLLIIWIFCLEKSMLFLVTLILVVLLILGKYYSWYIILTSLNFFQVAMTHPMAVTNCNIDMESLISDQNRSIATLAITTLLKTGNESSVDRLMKQITNFMSDIADEFKIVVVEAIRSLCLKFPLKYRALWVGYQIQFLFFLFQNVWFNMVISFTARILICVYFFK